MSAPTPRTAPTTHPTTRDLMDARSAEIGRQRFPDADDKLGWAREGARLNGIRYLTELINKGDKTNGAEPDC